MSYLQDENFIQAVRFIYEHLDQPLTLEAIAEHIGLSVSSLKHLFMTAINRTPGLFIRRLRMELAFRTLQSRQDSILEVALSTGFEDHSAFARSFKKNFGYSPAQARNKLNIINELAYVTLEEPEMIELDAIQLQSATEQGIYFESAKNAWEKLAKAMLENNVSTDATGLFIGIGHDNPHTTDPTQVRFTAGVALVEQNLNLGHFTIAAGHYARFRYQGKPNNLGLAYHYIFGQWAEKAAVNIDDQRPTFIVFDEFPAAMQEQHILIHAPVQMRK